MQEGSKGTWRAALAEAIEAQIGMRLTGHALDSLEGFVRGRLRMLGLPDARAYVERLLDDPVGEEATHLANSITNGETHFFRDEEQFEIIRRVVGELAAGRTAPLSIWSAGCASGEEAWSLGIVVAEAGIEATVLGTDVNTEALELARAGRYGRWSLRRVPNRVLERYFVPDGDGQRIRHERLPMVRFEHHNLVRDPTPPAPGGRWDLILCRNVFIYFPPERVDATVRRMAASLHPQGWLFVGAAEPVVSLGGPLHPEELGRRLGYRPGPAPSRPDASPPAAPELGTRSSAARTSGATSALRPPPGPPARRPAVTPPRRAKAPSPAAPPPKPSSPPSLEEAAGALARGEPDLAERLLQDVLALSPDDVMALLLLGHVNLSRHAFDDALELYGRVQARDALLPEVHYFEALVWRKLGDVGRAEAALRRAVFLAPTFWEAAFMLAGVYERLGRHGEARREYVRTVHVLDARGTTESPVAFRQALHRFLPDRSQASWLCRRQISSRP